MSGIDFKKAKLAQKIRQVVIADINGRRGFSFDDINEDVIEEINRELEAKIYKALREEQE